jgi:hypothetical protein
VQYWTCVASSADGTQLVAGVGGNGGPIYTSTNSGDIWTSNSVPMRVWTSIASSVNGSRLVAVAYPSIYTSTNSGAIWTSNSAPSANWYSVASSADGSKFVAVVNGGGIWTLQFTPTPQLNLASANGNLAFSWIMPSTNFVLQQSPDLTSASWTDMMNTPTLNLTNLQDEVTLSPPGSNVFYRLKTP